jgi:hypothetical protein
MDDEGPRVGPLRLYLTDDGDGTFQVLTPHDGAEIVP